MGYNERDAIRGDDSWKSFHEVMCLAKDKDVDMVLLAGDLFHENKPSRKSMYQVMRSLRMNCYGEKPCELEMLSDPSEVFQGYSPLPADIAGRKDPHEFELMLDVAHLGTQTTKTPTSMSQFQSFPSMAIMTIRPGYVLARSERLATLYLREAH